MQLPLQSTQSSGITILDEMRFPSYFYFMSTYLTCLIPRKNLKVSEKKLNAGGIHLRGKGNAHLQRYRLEFVKARELSDCDAFDSSAILF